MWLQFATWAWLSTAQAATVPAQAHPVLYLEQCSESPRASCWKQITPLKRFAAEPRAQVPPISADVRLAIHGANLLVRVDSVPAHHVVEVVIDQRGARNLSKAQLLRVDKGVVSHALGPVPEPGQTRAVRVLVRDMEKGDTFVWAPEGSGDLTRPAIAVVGSPPGNSVPVGVDHSDHTLRIDADQATSIHVSHRRPRLPQGTKGVGSAWSKSIQPGEVFDAPDFKGWYDIETTWRSETGNITQLQHHSFFWTPPPDPRVQALGIHPAPSHWAEGEGADLTVQGGMSICTDDPSLTVATDWLGKEIHRLTSRNISRSCRGSTPEGGGLWLRKIPADGPAPTVKGSPEWLAKVSDEGFYIETSSTGAEVWVHTPRAGLYGAQALADLLGMDGRAQALVIMDNPAIRQRVLFHEVPPQSKGMASPKRYIQFIQNAVARARMNMLVIDLKGAYKYQSHPELVRPLAWSKAGLDKVLAAARELGIEVIPTINSPAHASWITNVHPQLAEETTGGLLCTRHPETRPLLRDLYDEMIQAFDQPRFVHIGHDEIRWRTRFKHEIQYCPRCEGTPRWALIADDLMWAHEVLGERGVKPMLWSDMLVSGWHGSWGGSYRAANRIPDDLRPDFMVMSWGRTGDSVGELVPAGYPVIRGNTGYTDWKRGGLESIALGVAGEGLALFYGRPWSTFGGSASPTILYHYWTNVLLAGATAWRPDIDDGSIDATMDHLMDHPAYLPAYRAWSDGSRFRSLTPSKKKSTRPGFDAVLPETAQVHEIPYEITGPHWASAEDTLEISVDGRIKGLSLLQATVFTPDAQAALSRKLKHDNHIDGPPVAIIDVVYANGQITAIPLHLGLDTAQPNLRDVAHSLWRTAGTLRVPSTAAAPLNDQARNRVLYRLDWRNPRPRAPVERISIRTTQAGASLVVGGLVAVEAP